MFADAATVRAVVNPILLIVVVPVVAWFVGYMLWVLGNDTVDAFKGDK